MRSLKERIIFLQRLRFSVVFNRTIKTVFMKKVFISIVSLILFTLISCQESNKIDYSVSLHQTDSVANLLIDLSFKPNKEGTTTLFFQDKAWGQENLHQVAKGLKIKDHVGEIIQQKDSNQFIIRHAKNLDKIHISYQIVQDTKEPIKLAETYRPIIQKKYFKVFSHNLFMLPEHLTEEGKKFTVEINWKEFDKDYKIANSFGYSKQQQKIENITREKFHSAFFAGGDFRIHPFKIDGNQVTFVIRGEWKAFQDSTMIQIIRKTLKTQRDFWKDHSQNYFSVAMLPTKLERGSEFQGSALTNSFLVSASNNEYLELDGLTYLLNHELQHNWNGNTILREKEEEHYWFSEGFTDYYTYKNIVTNRINNLDKSYYVDGINQIIRNLYISPVKEVPNKEINYKNFWSSHDYNKLPYRRGALFAFYLDHLIKKESKNQYSLDNVMLDFKNNAVEKGLKINHPYFIKTVNKYLQRDIKSFFDKHIEDGKLFDLQSIFNEFSLNHNKSCEVFDLGFEVNQNDGSVEKIDLKSNAHKAGIRNGNVINSWSYMYDPTKIAQVTVLKNGTEKVFEFYPAKEANIPQLKNNTQNQKILFE